MGLAGPLSLLAWWILCIIFPQHVIRLQGILLFLEGFVMGLLTWIVVGLIAGWLAGLVVKGGGFGVIGEIVLGIVGALLGGFLAGAIFGIPNAISGFNLTTI